MDVFNFDVAVEYLEKVGLTNLIQNLRTFVGLQPPLQQPKQHQSQEKGWKTDELLYPSDWRYQESVRKGRTSHKLLSPSGVRFPSVRTALLFMTKNNFPELDIAIMREALVAQNMWSNHPDLPENWLYRRAGVTNIEYCDPNGRSYRSKEKALIAIEDKEVTDKLRRFNPPESTQKRKRIQVVKKVKVDDSNLEDWKTDELL